MTREAHAHVQVIRRSAGQWEVTRVELLDQVDGEPAWRYEVLGRVVLDGGFYRAERAKWLVDGCEYERLPRPWLVLRPAVRSLTHPPPPAPRASA